MVDLAIYTLEGCSVCATLKKIATELAGLGDFDSVTLSFCHYIRVERSVSHEQNSLPSFEILCCGLADFQAATKIKPRVFPTVIAFVSTQPRAGWEGFAAMSPSEIQQASVREVFEQAASIIINTDI